MVTEFRHGIETVEVDDSLRPLQTGPSNIIDLIGTAPLADTDLFPINTPVLIPGDARFALGLGTTGTIPDAINGIFSQFGADVIVVRVEDDADVNEQLSNIIGVQTALTGIYAFKKARSMLSLVPKILIAPGFTSQRPADGIESVTINAGGTGYTVNTNGTNNVVITSSGGDGTGDQYSALVQNGHIIAVVPKKHGFGFTTPPTLAFADTLAHTATNAFTFSGLPSNSNTLVIGSQTYTWKTALSSGPTVANEVLIGVDVATSLGNLVAAVMAGSGIGTKYSTGTTANAKVTAVAEADDVTMTVTSKIAAASENSVSTSKTGTYGAWTSGTLTGGVGGSGAIATVVMGHVANPVVENMLTIAEDMRSIVIADNSVTNYVDAVAYRGDYDSDRLWIIDGGCQVWDVFLNGPVAEPVAPRLAGRQAFMDQHFGFWWSASNQPLNGIVGVERVIDWSFTSSTVEGQLLNSIGVAVLVREEGFKVLGVRSPTSDSLWQFLPVRRTADMVYDTIEAGLRIAIDRPINVGTIEWIEASINAYLRDLAVLGAIIDGKAWLDPTLNSPTDLQAGKLTIDFDIEPPAPLERLTFRAHRNASYYLEVVDAVLRDAA